MASVFCPLSDTYVPTNMRTVGFVDNAAINYAREQEAADSSDDSSVPDWYYSDDSSIVEDAPTPTAYDLRMMMRNMSLDESVELIRLVEMAYEERVELEILEEEAEALLTDEEKCSVCIQRAKDVVLAPCGHKCVCSECLNRLQSKVTPRAYRNKCPICRARFTMGVKVFE
jgi:hypothetical protein